MRIWWREAYRDYSLDARDGEHGVVAGGPPGRGVDHHVDGLVERRGGRGGVKHDVQQAGAEYLLQGVEGETSKLTLDEVWTI